MLENLIDRIRFNVSLPLNYILTVEVVSIYFQILGILRIPRRELLPVPRILQPILASSKNQGIFMRKNPLKVEKNNGEPKHFLMRCRGPLFHDIPESTCHYEVFGLSVIFLNYKGFFP
eukprot:TRINITY_DN51463_c0_g1_i1.p1 TRINITY_DN51463_c0_g1~~TRINITY_DN51463_c0_g1_i1.p1  ORF type:complete len:118 (+),score=4.13 TRINITY_DN51463_c0_g1_i1:108-461(+)